MASKKDSDIHESVSHTAFGRSRAMPGWRAIIAIALLAIAALVAIRTQFNSTETTEARIARGEKIRIGYAVEAPYAFLDEGGQVTGESPEVARIIWQKLGITDIAWVRTDFASLISQLRAGRFDMIAAGMFIRPDREKLVAFTSPSACIHTALLVRRDNPKGLHSYSDIAGKQEVRIAVLTGAVEGEEAVRAGVPADWIIGYPSPEVAVRGLLSGIVDGFALSSPSISRLALANPETENAQPFTASGDAVGCAAFAFRLNDKDLRDRFDQMLKTFLGSNEHLELIRPFGFNAEDLPGHQQERTSRRGE